MSKGIETDCLFLAAAEKHKKQNSQGVTTADFRHLLSELKRRPPSHRDFLRKLFSCAIANGAPTQFPVPSHAVHDPAGPS